MKYVQKLLLNAQSVTVEAPPCLYICPSEYDCVILHFLTPQHLTPHDVSHTHIHIPTPTHSPRPYRPVWNYRSSKSWRLNQHV